MREKCDQIAPLLEKLNLKYSEVAFIGNELLDIKLAKKAGLPINQIWQNQAQAVKDIVDMMR